LRVVIISCANGFLLSGVEIRALRKIRREQRPGCAMYLFRNGARRSPQTGSSRRSAGPPPASAWQRSPAPIAPCVRLQAGQRWGRYPHLAAYLGHRQIGNTTRYTKMDARRFDGFWQEWAGRRASPLRQ
jgi:hypothetical protein